MANSPELSILVIDDDAAVATVLVGLLHRSGVSAAREPSAEAALGRLEQEPFDALIVDVRMPGMSGLELQREVRQRWPDVRVILLTAYGTVPMAVQAIRDGASDFLLKPFEPEDISQVIEKLKRQQASPVFSTGSEWELIGNSAPMRNLAEQIRRVAATDATVLIRGESGTGKELVARALHLEGHRSSEPFIGIHCGAIPETLLEAELFGHERGAFTGAVRSRPGRVEMAEGGTLFLDEVGDVSPLTQVKLLRLVQEKQYERVGRAATRTADVRLIAATHRDLESMVAREEFRLDLFYRLNVVPLEVLPLRERSEDIPLLLSHFVRVLCREYKLPPREFDPAAIAVLQRHAWPGNVRELRNLVERVLVLSTTQSIAESDIRLHLGVSVVPDSVTDKKPARGRRSELSREQLSTALTQSGDNRALAARLLGVSRRTLYNRLRHFGMD